MLVNAFEHVLVMTLELSVTLLSDRCRGLSHLMFSACFVIRDGSHLCHLLIRSSADVVDDGVVVGERVGHIDRAHVLCHVSSDDLYMYDVAGCR